MGWLPRGHTIIAISNNIIQNGRRIAEKVHHVPLYNSMKRLFCKGVRSRTVIWVILSTFKLGTRGEGLMEPLPWVLVLLRHSEKDLRWVGSPKPPLTRRCHFVGYDVLWPVVFDFTIFSKSQEITEIIAKSKHNVSEKWQKNTNSMSKELIAGKTCMTERVGCHGYIKNDRHK